LTVRAYTDHATATDAYGN